MRKNIGKNVRKIAATFVMTVCLGASLVGCSSSSTSGNGSNGGDGKSDSLTETVAEKTTFAAFDASKYPQPKKIGDKLCEGFVGADMDEHFAYSEYAESVTVYYVGGLGEKVVYPSEHNGKPVRCIAYSQTMSGLFSDADVKDDYTKVTEIVIPDTVWALNEEAFAGCTAIKEITIPEGVVFVAYKSFARCKSLEVVNLPSTILYVGSAIVQDCSSLKAVNIKAKNFDTPNDVFTGSRNVKEFTYQ